MTSEPDFLDLCPELWCIEQPPEDKVSTDEDCYWARYKLPPRIAELEPDAFWRFIGAAAEHIMETLNEAMNDPEGPGRPPFVEYYVWEFHSAIVFAYEIGSN